jgi:hypothetical protein
MKVRRKKIDVNAISFMSTNIRVSETAAILVELGMNVAPSEVALDM